MTSAPAGDQPVRAGWPDLLTALLQGQDLDYQQTAWAMGQVMEGLAHPAQLAGFLVALRAKGETVQELQALADMMLEHARRIEVPGPSVDIVGTGGDRLNTVNISTMSSIVMAATGLRVVKHGNRAASSKSGSADVLENLGVNLTLTPERVVEVAHEAGITFCFANVFHPSMRYAGEARSALGIGTAFNVLGPLTNPAQPTYAAVGAADARMVDLIAGVFASRGKDAAVFRGEEGLDEMSVVGPSRLLWVRRGHVRECVMAPQELGLDRHPLESIRGADAAFNADVARRVLAGEPGGPRDAVLLNAGTALALAAPDSGETDDDLRQDLRAGIARAAEAIDSGAAAATLQRWVEVSNA